MLNFLYLGLRKKLINGRIKFFEVLKKFIMASKRVNIFESVFGEREP